MTAEASSAGRPFRVPGAPLGRWAPHRLADAAIKRQYRRADARCARVPEWAAIESKRRTSGETTRVLLSDDLDWADFERQRQIRVRVSPDPLWMPVARFVSRRPLGQLARSVLSAVQRARRGWSDRDAWNADHHLCRVTAGMLRHLATSGIGWPDGEFASPAEWSSALLEHAVALEAWAESMVDGADDLAAEEKAIEGAQDSFRWVAEHLPSLWD